MRVLHWVNVFPGRYESFVEQQIRALRNAGCELAIVAERNGRPLPEDAPPTIFLPPTAPTRARRLREGIAGGIRQMVRQPMAVAQSLSRGEMSLLSRVPQLRELPETDIVHCHFAQLGRKALRFRELGAIRGKIVTSIRGSDFRRIEQQRSQYRELLAEGDLFLPVTEDFRRRLINFGCPPQRAVVLRSGVDCDKVSEARNGVPAEENLVLSVGRLVAKKGFDDAIRAIAIVAETNSAVRLRIIGEGALEPDLRSLARELGIADRVEFAGWCDHQQTLRQMAGCTVLLQPSKTDANGAQEGIPNVLKEAMLLGKPVVSTRHAGITELVKDGKTGLLAEENNPQQLAAHIQALVLDAALRGRIAEESPRRVRTEYESSRITSQLMDLYESLMI